MMRDNGRLHWIDTAKAIGMILVYMYHAEVKYGCESELLFNLRSPFYVNVFFFVSGFLLYRCGKSASDIARNALLRIYLPSVLVASLLFVPKMMANGGALDFRAFLPDAVGGGAFWFTSALIVAELIWCGIVLLGKDFRLAKITAISAITATVAIIFFRDENAIMHFNSGMYSMIFLAAGTLFCHFEDKIQIDSGLPVCILTMIVSSVLIIIFGRQITQAESFAGGEDRQEGEVFGGFPDRDMVQAGGGLAGSAAEQAAQALDVLAFDCGAAEDDANVGVGYVDALVQTAAADQHAGAVFMESLQIAFSGITGHAGMINNAYVAHASPDGSRHFFGLGDPLAENEDTIRGMQAEQKRESAAHAGSGGNGYLLPLISFEQESGGGFCRVHVGLMSDMGNSLEKPLLFHFLQRGICCVQMLQLERDFR